MVKLYKVGGCVRDEILGLKSKDIDYAVTASSYEEMKNYLISLEANIFLEKPEYLTIRAKVKGEDADFVLCRKDGAYSDGRRPDSVEMGTIEDDLARRDFTMNAIAIDEDGKYIDPFNGIQDIKNSVIKCVGSTERLLEDSLRMLRALRFLITKKFSIHRDISNVIWTDYQLLKNISRERIYEELNKMFAHDTNSTFSLMCYYKEVFSFIFSECKVDLAAVLKKN